MASYELGKAYVQIVPSFKGMQGAIQKELGGSANVQKSLGSRLGGNIVSGLKTAFKVGGAAVAGLFGTALVKGFNRLKDIENAEASLRGLGMAAGEVEGVMENALAAVKGTAFGMDEAAQSAALLSVSGIQAGEDMERHLGLAADMAAQTNSSLGDMGSIYSKVAAQGKLTGDVNQQLMDRGINAYAVVAEHIGITTEAAMEMGRKGEISFEVFAEAMESKVGGAALEMGKTTTGAWANMNAALSRFGVAFLEDIFPLIGPAMNRITEWLDDMTGKVGPFLDGLIDGFKGLYSILFEGDFPGTFWGLEEDSPIVDFLFNVREGVNGLYSILFKGDYPGSFWGLEEDSPLIDFLFNVRERAVAIGDWLKYDLPPLLDDVKDKIDENEESIRKVVISIGAAAGAFIAFKAASAIVGAVTTALTFLKTALSTLFTGNPILLILTLLAGAFVYLWQTSETFRDIVTGVFDAVRDRIERAWETIKGVFDNFSVSGDETADKLGNAWTRFKEVFEPVITAVTGLIEDTLLPIFWDIYDTAEEVIGKVIGFFTRLWESIEPVFMRIVNLVVDKVVPTIASAIDLISAAISTAWYGIIKPIFEIIVWTLENVLGPIFFWLLDHVIRPVWDAIVTAIEVAWTVIKGVFDTVAAVLKGDFAGAWDAAKTMVITAFTALKDGVVGIWDDYIFPFLKTIGDTLHEWLVKPFQDAVDTIGQAWDKVKEWFRAPINWVIEHVINGGVIAFVNAITSALGLGNVLSNVRTIGAPAQGRTATPRRAGMGGGNTFTGGYAKGGYAPPGWALVGEEGPELIDLRTPGRVYTAGETAQAIAGSRLSKSLIPDRLYTAPEAHFALSALRSGDPDMLSLAAGTSERDALLPAGGNIFTKAGGWISSAWDGITSWTADIAGKAVSFVRGRLADAAKTVIRPLQGLVRSNVKGVFGDFFVGAGDKLIDWIAGVDKDTEELVQLGDAFGGVFDGLDSGGRAKPVNGRLTSLFGPRWGGHHAGVDWAVPTGTAVKAWRDGVVTRAGWNVLAGRTGIGMLLSHANGYGSYYGHLSRALLSPGATVKAGQRIGLSGNTGRSTGPHLHFEVSRNNNPQAVVNPLRYFDQGGYLPPGVSTVANLTGKPEPVFTSEQWATLESAVTGGSTGTTKIAFYDSDDIFRGYMDGRVEHGFETAGRY